MSTVSADILNEPANGVSWLAHWQIQAKKICDAAEKGDASAAWQLIELASSATRRLENLYRAKPKLVKEVAKSRREFPMLHLWSDTNFVVRLSKKKDEDISAFDSFDDLKMSQRYQMLIELAGGVEGPFAIQVRRRGRPAKRDELRSMLVDEIYRDFELVRSGDDSLWPPDASIEKRIARLSPLTLESLDAWTKLMVARLLQIQGGRQVLADRNHWLNKHARIDRAKQRNQQKREKRVKRRYSNNVYPDSPEGRRKEQSDKLKLNAELEKIRNEGSTKADREKLLKETIKVRLKNIMKKPSNDGKMA